MPTSPRVIFPQQYVTSETYLIAPGESWRFNPIWSDFSTMMRPILICRGDIGIRMSCRKKSNGAMKAVVRMPRRLEREKKTIALMVRMSCRAFHDSPKVLCPECADLLHYALQRIEHCRYGVEKPTCVNCPTHCYKPEMRDNIRRVMRFAGPKMLWRHPVLTLLHLQDGRRRLSRAFSTDGEVKEKIS